MSAGTQLSAAERQAIRQWHIDYRYGDFYLGQSQTANNLDLIATTDPHRIFQSTQVHHTLIDLDSGQAFTSLPLSGASDIAIPSCIKRYEWTVLPYQYSRVWQAFAETAPPQPMSTDDSFADEEFFSSPTSSLGSSSSSMKDDSSHFSSMED